MARVKTASYRNVEKKARSSLKEDRLTSLPKNVIEAILICVPLKDAVRTSILSRAWRYEWSNVSQLVFHHDDFVSSGRDELQTRYDRKLVKIVDQVLLLHQGPVHIFKFSTALASCMDIDRWILFLSRNGIREFTLEKWRGQIYKIPSCLFSCKDIIYMELSGGVSIPPASCTVPSNLRTLVLDELSFSNNELENLISNCRLLSMLKLISIKDCIHLKLYAPNLIDLTIKDSFKDVSFDRTPLLSKASIGLNSCRSSSNGAICKLINILDCLPSIKSLELVDHTYEILSAGDIPVRLLTDCQLLHLSANINFEDEQQSLAALCLFKRSSILQKLDIESLSGIYEEEISNVDFWEVQEDLNGVFRQLQTLNVKEFMGTKSELRFIEFVLAHAPLLGMLCIVLKTDTIDADLKEILRELAQFRRLSVNAEVIFYMKARFSFRKNDIRPVRISLI